MRLIDADALLKEWRLECGGACFVGKGRYCMHYDKTKSICTLIVKAPTIEAEPIKHGHWITKALSAEQSIDDLPRLISKCSVCGKKLQFVTLATQMPYKFCPNCGSRMDEVKE